MHPSPPLLACRAPGSTDPNTGSGNMLVYEEKLARHLREGVPPGQKPWQEIDHTAVGAWRRCNNKPRRLL
jgi:hypothetical protein